MIERRDLIKLGAGVAVGTGLTPIPWKLLDDTAIWSQNWSWIPKVPRGEITVRNSTCTLCPAGCGVRAQCVAGAAVGIAGVGEHPLSRGTLCPAGFGSHCAAYHPRRIRQPQGALDALAGALKRGPMAILDLGPRRAVSSLYADAAEAKGGMYLRVANRDEAFLDVLVTRLGREPGSLGVDLENARTVISFGAPVLDGWATPGRVMERWRSGELQVIQVERRQSRTALAANRWVRSFEEIGGGFEKPAAVVGAEDLDRVADLNLEFGSFVARRPLPFADPAGRMLSSVPDGSLSALFIDSSRAYDVIPWPAIQRKLADRAVVVAFAYKQDALTRHADVVLPVAAPYETAEDLGTPPCSAVAAYCTSPALIDIPGVKETPVDHLNKLLGLSLEPVAEVIKKRVAAIEQSKRGTVTKLGEAIAWVDEPCGASFRLRGTSVPPSRAEARSELKLTPQQLKLQIHSDRASDTTPLQTKLDQESGLYTPPAIARLNPETARGLNLQNGVNALLETKHGSATRQVLLDPAVAPGIIEVAVTPAADDVLNITDGSLTPVNARRA
jgi:hypothetical protein